MMEIEVALKLFRSSGCFRAIAWFKREIRMSQCKRDNVDKLTLKDGAQLTAPSQTKLAVEAHQAPSKY